MKEKQKSGKQKAALMLVEFVVIMLVLTLVSRGAAAMTYARVELTSGKYASISHDIVVSGEIIPAGEVAIYVPADLRVAHVDVKTGNVIAAGEVLFTADLTYLDEKITELNGQIDLLNTQIQEVKNQESFQTAQKNTGIARATEDYQIAVNEQEQALNTAYAALQTANQKLSEHQGSTPEAEEQAAYDAKTAELQADCDAKNAAYEAAVKIKDSAIKSAARVLEDAKAQPDASSSTQSQEMEVNKLKEKLALLTEVKENDGKVTTPQSGQLTEIYLEMGMITTSSMAAVAADTTEGYVFNGQIERDQGKNLSVGDCATLQLGSETLEDVVITEVGSAKENEELLEVSAEINGELEKGGSSFLTVIKSSEKYPVCVPLSALHMESGNLCVYIMSEQSTILGIRQIAKRVNVVIKDQNESMAAVDGNLTSEDLIITTSNKPIKSGAYVRLEEE